MIQIQFTPCLLSKKTLSITVFEVGENNDYDPLSDDSGSFYCIHNTRVFLFLPCQQSANFVQAESGVNQIWQYHSLLLMIGLEWAWKPGSQGWQRRRKGKLLETLGGAYKKRESQARKLLPPPLPSCLRSRAQGCEAWITLPP